MSTDAHSIPPLEIAHVLFMDLVGYSLLPIDSQTRLIEELQTVVRDTPVFKKNEARGELIRLARGDGMALVFFLDLIAPIRCSLEIARALQDHPEIKLRMGVHSGPVYRVADINVQQDVSGGGIVMAQRVMDCGDAGHILLSGSVAEVLLQHSDWSDKVYDLGECEVKHGERVHLFNLYTDDLGNPSMPEKLRPEGDDGTSEGQKDEERTATTLPGHLAHYRIIRPLGKGGMGEVYLAEDTKLDRQVAIKVLPETMRNDPERLARFRREARAAASLKHNNIATIHAIEEADNVLFIVMEHVEGDTLSDRIPKDGMDLDTFFSTFIPLADALAHAHENGRIHRDLKPGNIMVTSDGTPKILDFGLARIMPLQPDLQEVDSEASTQTMQSDESQTDPSAMTQGPRLMGTPMYMSPEQAEQEPVDHRTDIFSFGVVMYEALTGRKAFEGGSRTSLLGRIVNDDPEPVTAIKPVTPYLLWQALRRCLEKDREERTQTARELHAELRHVNREVQAGTVLVDASTIPSPEPVVVPVPVPFWQRPVAIGVFLLFGIITALGGWLLKPKAEPPQPPLRKFDWPAENLLWPVISPDGTMVAYSSSDGKRLWVRDLDRTEPREIIAIDPDSPGRVMSPFWSPESDYIGYWNNDFSRRPGKRSLWKASVKGEDPLPICTIPAGIGLAFQTLTATCTWGADDRIAFASWNGWLYEVSALGGEPTVFLKPDSTLNEQWFGRPRFLPDGRTLLFAVERSGDSTAVEAMAKRYDNQDLLFAANIRRGGFVSQDIVAYSEATGRRVLDLPERFVHGVEGFSPSGHLLYRHLLDNQLSTEYQQHRLWAIPFDLETLAVTGIPLFVASGSFSVSVSADGTLVHRKTPQRRPSRLQLVWVDRTGDILGIIGQPQESLNLPALSPDDRLVAIVVKSQESRDIWIQDIARDIKTRITFGMTANDISWSPDGTHLVFCRNFGLRNGLFIVPVDGSGEPDSLVLSPNINLKVSSWSPDGKYLAYNRGLSNDISYIRMDGDRNHRQIPQPILKTPFQESHPQISPDGRYLAYQSDESGKWQVYLTRFPEGTGKWQVSRDGGILPRWSDRTHELFFVVDGILMAAKVTLRDTPLIGSLRKLFTEDRADVSFTGEHWGNYNYDVSADGQRFVMVQKVDGDEPDKPPTITVVENWYAEFKDRE